MTVPPLELSDRYRDALTLHVDDAGLWVTCTSGDQEVTVGPLAREAIADWLEAGAEAA
ncbi:hypothetical protein [Brachybacterium sp. UNK5269]|uniref:hypothetical protein n=1 Tax=Brachybacterium sp. UNK5269 TaxID=3408576 RepID=UPI003BB05DE6